VEIYLNLASRLKIGGPNQVCVADITYYIRLKTEFVYLAVVLDAFSRKVVGWSLDRTLQSRLPLGALKQAILDSVQGILFCSLDCGSASSFTHRQNPFQ
jgi:transposase InsO family protein